MALVEIETFPDRMIAEMARGRLAAEGIEAILFDGGVAGLGLGGLLPARLMVDEADEARALRSLEPDF
ncbi:putative signal transducing protein [Sphingomonas abietis]|uniref:DUF2007 domain-containing protein n=1 Tax=Sphingomonas abietis TaxID=3012344 RepID=A0ABY7NLT4_9SPHN|nr:DUF2007 domain-containing protein [Sphingomonas abietis]WBO22478.1 DUF2007 domain-containing protein [Sphingomonas abietis]